MIYIKNSKLVLTTALMLFALLTVTSAQSFLDIRLKNVDGSYSSIRELSGENEIIVLDFWATWCKPCVKSIPKLIGINDKYGSKGVSLIGINEDSPRNISKVKPFVNSHSINYPVLLDTKQEIMSELLVYALPTLMILDKKGKIHYVHEGFYIGDEAIITEELEKLLQ